MLEDKFEEFLKEKNTQINLFIDKSFKDDNDVNTSLNNLKNLGLFFQQNEIDIEMINVEDLISHNQKLFKCLNSIILNMNSDIIQKLNNNTFTTLIISFCKLYNISNSHVNVLINSTINPYDNESQKELIKKVKMGDKKAKELLIIANDGLVRKFVFKNKYKIKNTSLDEEDLLQVGRMGIIEAAENFDFNKNVSFSTYAIYHLLKYINEEIYKQVRTIRIPVYVYKLINEYKFIENLYITKYGYMPSEEEIAKEMKISIEKVKEIAKLKVAALSLDKKVRGELDSDDDVKIIDFISDEKQDFEEDVIYNAYLYEIKLKIEKADNISERNKEIIKLRYGFDDHIIRTYDVIADIYHIKKERVRQIIDKNLEKIGYDNRLNKIERPIRECVPRRKKNIC